MNAKMAVSEIVRILKAFPNVSDDFVDILFERAIAKGFTHNRFVDSVNNVIDNCQYPTPTLANFLSFDKRIKLLSYNQVCNEVTSQQAKFEDFTRIFINGKPFWITNADKEQYGLPIEL